MDILSVFLDINLNVWYNYIHVFIFYHYFNRPISSDSDDSRMAGFCVGIL